MRYSAYFTFPIHLGSPGVFFLFFGDKFPSFTRQKRKVMQQEEKEVEETLHRE
jgi:hypothetical protein